MNPFPAPATYILRKAWQLGQKMARKERRLWPDLLGAHEYPTYALFRQAHRCRLEQRPAYQTWDPKLQALVEREANGRGLRLNDPRWWDAFYTQVSGPIRQVFWAGWEDAYRLEALYKQAVARAEQNRLANPGTLHVYRGVRPAVDLTDGIAERDQDTDVIIAQMGAEGSEQPPDVPRAQ